MRDSELTPMSLATAEVDDSRPIATVSPAIAMIDEGNALEEQGRSAEAMARYDAAVQADPRCARAHLNRGNVLLAGAQIDEARSAYQLAIACDPHYAAAHFNLGNLNCRAGEYERAVHNYQVAIAIKPDFADAFVALGNALDDLGRTSEAVESYERALAINPGDARVHFNLGLLALTEGSGRRREPSEGYRRCATLCCGASTPWEGPLARPIAAAQPSPRVVPRAESEEILDHLATFLEARQAWKRLPAIALLERAPTWTIMKAFASCVARIRFMINDSRIRAALAAAVTEPWAIPFSLAGPHSV